MGQAEKEEVTQKANRPPLEHIQLVTDRLILKPTACADPAVIYAAVEKTIHTLQPWLPWATGYSVASAQEFIDLQRKNYAEHGSLALLLYLEDTIIGSVGAQFHESPIHGFELGYWLSAEHTGNGYITEAATALINYLAANRPLPRVWGCCNKDNANSRKVFERLGFKYEGKLKQADLTPSGAVGDLLIYGHTAKSWAAYNKGKSG